MSFCFILRGLLKFNVYSTPEILGKQVNSETGGRVGAGLMSHILYLSKEYTSDDIIVRSFFLASSGGDEL